MCIEKTCQEHGKIKVKCFIVYFLCLINDSLRFMESMFSANICPFFDRAFSLAWDCKIAYYHLAYHSWCVGAHFSTSWYVFN